ncbi:hypothetical protein A0J61_05330, partial [Choanephora cucurbitarum]
MTDDTTPRRSERKRRSNQDTESEYDINPSNADHNQDPLKDLEDKTGKIKEHYVKEEGKLRLQASRQRRRQLQSDRNDTNGFDLIVQKCQTEIRKGPTIVCVCCDGLWCPDQTKSVTKDSLFARNASQEFIDDMLRFNQHQDSNVFCFNCSLDVKNLHKPRLCVSNGLELPEIPEALTCLNRVEERLVSARHVFQSIYTVLGLRGQHKSEGGILNVPVSVDKTISCVPRSLTDSNTIEVRLTRRLAQSNNYMAGNVRLEKIWAAAHFLSQSAAYMKHNVKIRDSEEEYNQLSTLIAQSHEFEQLVIALSELTIDSDNIADDLENDLTWESNPGGQETKFAGELTARIVQEDEGVRIAPAEGSSPMSLLLDKDVESLAFPTLFSGAILDPKHKGVPLSYSAIAKSL